MSGSASGPTECTICDSPEGRPKHVLMELRASWLNAYPGRSTLRGYVTVFSKVHADEPFDLPLDERAKFWEDCLSVARAQKRAFAASKINYEIHGNTLRHLHMHLFPRYPKDAFTGRPIDPRTQPSATTAVDLRRLVDAVAEELHR